jgi:N-acetylglucosamine-6-sulfatase
VRKCLSIAAAVAAALFATGCGTEVEKDPQKPTITQELVQKPNILFVLTDDQEPASLVYMPTVRQKLLEGGTTFENAFATTPQCCPSRASFLTGQYAHNHGVMHNDTPQGGFEKFRKSGGQHSTVATWLSDAGYRTAYIGKYLNGYDTKHVPPGWERWWGWSGQGPSEYQITKDGHLDPQRRDKATETDYFADKAVSFVKDRKGDSRPWLLWISANPPKGGRYVAPRHSSMLSDVGMPKPPSFNEADVSDKPSFVRSLEMLDETDVVKAEETYRDRLRSLQSVDEMVARLFRTLKQTGQLEHTYVFYASDNGYSLYEHRVSAKGFPYENPQKIPLIVRGPGIPASAERMQLVANTDLAPTLAELAGVEVPSFVDGRSFVPLLRGEQLPWRERLLFEHWGQRRYDAMRTAEGEVYVEWMSGEKEYYDLSEDPDQLQNVYSALDPALKEELARRLEALRSCAEEACRAAEN